ncbi:hypothetical protein [Saccharopolyspora phatthalungensis]|uniref:Uncharacterized protein n=1 Tax=Saccharopolyspora phatthalungensis TaxID=664693 RepID=A0A840QB63_9PSEU|nr:hypothetical protein [Saccharopolyspora phatthalungensis]MBB5157021.1 hypothetical protein [Saccharopolyspora phatthalungensis]
MSEGVEYEFHDTLIPNLKVGLYTITTKHELSVDDTGYFDTPVVRTLDVRAPRFGLPEKAVHAVYPTAGCTGKFDQILPHITLDRPALPWESTISESPADAKRPWLALLLFAAKELPGDPEAVGVTDSRTVRGLRQTPSNEAIAPELADIEPDLLDSVCRTLDVPGELFDQIAPKYDELGLLTHLRRSGDETASLATLAARARARSLRGVPRTVSLKGFADGDDPRYAGLHAVVIGNRFPDEGGGQFAAHLVSLEGFRPYLTREKKSTLPLRMVALHSWTFRSLPDTGSHFGVLMEHLAEPDGAAQTDPDRLTLRLDPTGASGEVKDRLTAGYVPLTYQLGSGERTFAWYRGPLTATPAQPVPTPTAPEAVLTSDAWLVYLERYGLFDASYATAWTMGRSLALADPGFAPALMAWRKAACRHLGRLLSATARPSHGSQAGAGIAFQGLSAVTALGHRPVRDRFEKRVRQDFAATLTKALSSATLERPPAGVDQDSLSAMAVLRDAWEKDPLVQQSVSSATKPQADPVLDWLDRLALLYPVPFDHLVPRDHLLPTESLRFFHVDRGWQTALVFGALSIGVAGSLDAALNTLLHQVITSIPATMSGVVIRSALVPSWPALRVHVSGTEKNGKRGELAVLRADTLAPDVALILVDGVLDELTVAEPAQGLHFGYEIDAKHGPHVHLRDLRNDIGHPLDEVYLTGFTSDYLRGGQRVLDVSQLLADIPAKLGAHSQPDGLTPAGLAVQLVAAPQQMTFRRH